MKFEYNPDVEGYYIDLSRPEILLLDYKNIEKCIENSGLSLNGYNLRYLNEIYFLVFNSDGYLKYMFTENTREWDDDEEEYIYDYDKESFFEWVEDETNYFSSDLKEFVLVTDEIPLGEL